MLARSRNERRNKNVSHGIIFQSSFHINLFSYARFSSIDILFHSFGVSWPVTVSPATSSLIPYWSMTAEIESFSSERNTLGDLSNSLRRLADLRKVTIWHKAPLFITRKWRELQIFYVREMRLPFRRWLDRNLPEGHMEHLLLQQATTNVQWRKIISNPPEGPLKKMWHGYEHPYKVTVWNEHYLQLSIHPSTQRPTHPHQSIRHPSFN